MKPERSCIGALALLMGCGGGHGANQNDGEVDGGVGDGANPTGCVSIALPLPGSEARVLPINVPLKGGVWRSRNGLHALWGEWPAGAGVGARPVLALATFDPGTGAIQHQRYYNIYPEGSTGFSLNGAAGLDDGTFAVGFGWTGGGAPSLGKLLIANADDASKRVDVDLGRSDPWRGLSDVAWDGEAFAVHAWTDRVTQSLLIGRISVTGDVLLPLTEYGKSPSGGFAEPEERFGGFTLATSPSSGRSYHYDPRAGRLLNGHDRQGNSLPWLPLSPIGRTGSGADFAGSRADNAGGVWLAWEDLDSTGGERVGTGAHVTAQGQIDHLFAFASPADDPFSTPSPIKSRPGLLLRGPSGVTVFATTWYRIYIYDYNGDAVSEPRVLFQDRAIYRKVSCHLFIWNLGPIAWGDEEWLSFIEERAANTRVLRIVKLQDGCRYHTESRLPEATCE